jgi:predicted HicB family RNase H-like nuclease
MTKKNRPLPPYNQRRLESPEARTRICIRAQRSLVEDLMSEAHRKGISMARLVVECLESRMKEG